MPGFGQIDRGQVDKIRQIIAEAAQRRQAIIQAQAQADREGMQLKMQLVQNEQTNRLLDAYQRIMSSDAPAEDKLNRVGPLIGLASRVNPQLAQSLNEQTGRMIQSENLGLRKSEIQSTEESRRAMEADRQLSNQIRIEGLGIQRSNAASLAEQRRMTAQRPWIEQYNKLLEGRRAISANAAALPWDQQNWEASREKLKGYLQNEHDVLGQLGQVGGQLGYDTTWVAPAQADVQKKLQKYQTMANPWDKSAGGGTGSSDNSDPLGILGQQ